MLDLRNILMENVICLMQFYKSDYEIPRNQVHSFAKVNQDFHTSLCM